MDVLRELDPENVGGCSCPNVRSLTLRLDDGGISETRKAIVGVVEKRRSETRPSSVARLDKLDVRFRVASGRSIFQELRSRGVDMDGISIGMDQPPDLSIL